MTLHRRSLLLATVPLPALALEAGPLAFPRDHGSHPAARTEWWYVTGALQAGARAFGFQITFFRSRTGLAAGPSRFGAAQVLSAHAAVSDVGAARLLHDQRIARAGFGVAEAAEDRLDLRLRGWTLASTATGWQAHAECDGFGFTLALEARQPPLLQGEAGWSRKGPDASHASRYVSVPQLHAAGRLRIGAATQSVVGRAWLDHEWSDALLAPGAVGWEWIGMNLDDGGALTAFRIRRADGTGLWAGGSHRTASGTLRTFGPDEVRFTPMRQWRSPATGTLYPVQWRVDTPAGRFEVKPRFDAQELDSRASTGTVYWEGLARLEDAAGRPVGEGYLELTGHHAPLAI